MWLAFHLLKDWVNTAVVFVTLCTCVCVRVSVCVSSVHIPCHSHRPPTHYLPAPQSTLACTGTHGKAAAVCKNQLVVTCKTSSCKPLQRSITQLGKPRHGAPSHPHHGYKRVHRCVVTRQGALGQYGASNKVRNSIYTRTKVGHHGYQN